jgi:glutamate N-acetyltransferase/amino-acid N-acetyltransferase
MIGAAEGNTQTVAGGVTAPAGFRASGVACGIKSNGKADLSLLVSDSEAATAAVFTTNVAQAAPILISREHLEQSRGRAAAVIVNSGCANACTGADGLRDAREMTRLTAEVLGGAATSVLVASTGVIGVKLPMGKVAAGIRSAAAALSYGGGADAARGIMTTDPFSKEAAAEAVVRGRTFRVGGMAKGSGMIEPMMATMLGFVTTDAEVEPGLLQRALKAAADDTFNAISVDGECSTNDCVFALANGASGVRLGPDDYSTLVAALKQVCEPLAIDIVRGGEGATKLITIRVTGAGNDADAKATARAIANSPLVKTAVHGGDPNWGRLVAVAGRATRTLVLDRAKVRIGPVELFADGAPYDERAPEAADYLQGKEIAIEVDLGTGGPGTARMWTCDLTAEYVRINADYRT